MKLCGKLYRDERDRVLECGGQLSGSDWVYQCIDCQLADFTGQTKKQDPNDRAVDDILARLESYYRGDENLAPGARFLSVNTGDLRALTDYIHFLRGQLRAANNKARKKDVD